MPPLPSHNPFLPDPAKALVRKMLREGEDDSPLDFSDIPDLPVNSIGTGPYTFDISTAGDFPDSGTEPQIAENLINHLKSTGHDPLSIFMGACQMSSILTTVQEAIRAEALEQAERDGHKKYRGALIRKRKRTYTFYTQDLDKLKRKQAEVKEKEAELKSLQSEIAKQGGRAEAPMVSGLFVYFQSTDTPQTEE